MADIVHTGDARPRSLANHRPVEFLESLLKTQLEDMAREFNVKVEGTGYEGNVLKKDLIKALRTD